MSALLMVFGCHIDGLTFLFVLQAEVPQLG